MVHQETTVTQAPRVTTALPDEMESQVLLVCRVMLATLVSAVTTAILVRRVLKVCLDLMERKVPKVPKVSAETQAFQEFQEKAVRQASPVQMACQENPDILGNLVWSANLETMVTPESRESTAALASTEILDLVVFLVMMVCPVCQVQPVQTVIPV